MLRVRSKGNYNKAYKYFQGLRDLSAGAIFRKYAEAGVAALSAATPVDTGTTADSWGYEIKQGPEKTTICFTNSNINDGINVAVILQYGHATQNGAYVEGIDYINPAIAHIFNDMARDLWTEVTAL